MRKFLFLTVALFVFASCGNPGKNTTEENTNTQSLANDADDSMVYVYYFHGKQRCKTCIAVEEVAINTLTETYSNNPKVKYVEVITDDKENEKLVEKYEVTWNALVIVKGNSHVDITNQAFANAVNNAEVLTELIKTEVEKKLAL